VRGIETMPTTAQGAQVPAPTLRLTAEPLAGATAEVVAIAMAPGADGPRLVGADHSYLAGLGFDPDTVLARERAKGDAGELLSLPGPAEGPERLLLVGVGDGGPLALRRAGAALGRRCRDRKDLFTTVAATGEASTLRAFAEGLLLGAYRFRRAGARQAGASQDREPDRGPVAVSIAGRVTATRQRALDLAVATGQAVWLARDLANTPSDRKTPAWLANEARAVAKRAGLSFRVRDERELAADGFNGLLAVGAGSGQPPRLIELGYTPAAVTDRTPHVVLIGKGITFDSGGLSLKPRESMVPMKTDMAGGGAVIAAMGALAALGVRVRVSALVAAAENMPSGSAMRPGDVIRHYGGRTVEVANTDAEGRLVLADALAYAVEQLEPTEMIDVATLTGAATLGLGRRHAALYATDERLAERLVAAGAASGERLWRMPLVEDYRFVLDSDVADLCHIARVPGIGGGSIIAALFLREFAGRVPWAHLDIAGPGRADGDEHEVTKGATGFGTRSMLRYLENRRAG
jgi:leucyl aminopeptidase